MDTHLQFSAIFTNGNNFCDFLFAYMGDKALCCFVALLFYVHGKHLRSCRDGQLT